MELTDGELQSLLQTGAFKMSIPPRLKNKVNSLILKRPDRFKDEVAVLFNDVDKRSNTIAISIDDSTIEQIAYQPVELKIYESGYTNIMVRYTPGNGAQVKKPSKTDSVELKIELNNGKAITGRLSYMTQFPLKSNLGKIKVKLDEVSQITFDDNGDLRVVMFNGDTLKGESNFSSLIINSRWGQERIKTKDIASITPALSKASSASNMTIPSLPLTNGSVGQTIQGYSAVSVMQQPMNQTVYGQSYHQHQFPMGTGRIDTVPRSPRQNYMYGQPMPMGSLYGVQGHAHTALPYHVPQTQLPIQQHTTQQHTTYGVYGQTVMPSQNVVISEGLPLGSIPMNQVPIRAQPITDSLIGQPLPMMTPNQANENWFFPEN